MAKKRTKKQAIRKKAIRKKATRKRATQKKRTRRSKPVRRKKTTRPSKRSRPQAITPTTRRSPLVTSSLDASPMGRRGLGPGSAGQSGDTQGLSSAEEADSESVEELAEEGQNFEAGILAGVEEADASQSEVRTKQVAEDDVPLEYREKD